MVAKKESRYYDAKEKMSLSKRQSYYNQSLVKMVRQGYKKSSRVKKIFDERNVDPLKIKSVNDLEKLPVIRAPVSFQEARPTRCSSDPTER